MIRQRAAQNDGTAGKALIASLTLGMVCILLLACVPVPDPAPAPVATITPAAPTKIYSHRGKITALFCDDTSGSYNRNYFEAGRDLIGTSFASAVQPNQDGVTLYVATINYDPVVPQNSLDPLTIPAIQDYPAPVKAKPYPTLTNKFSAEVTKTVIDGENEQAISAYNAAVAQVDKTVATTLASVQQNEIKRLQDWNPPTDYRGTSVYGCLYLVKTRLQVTTNIKQLFIASDLGDNVNTSLTGDLVQAQVLKDVSVHVLYLPGNTRDNTTRADWCAFFHDAGASAVRFDDTATSDTLSDLFNADLHLSSTC